MKTNRPIILQLVAFQTNLLLAHWQADTLTNAHKALGDLYAEVSEKIDELSEVSMGKDNDREFPEETFQIAPDLALPELFYFGLGAVAAFRETCTPGEDDDLLNIAADISAAINHAKYFLRIDPTALRS